MPYSLMPELSENNRLDMIDFIDSSLKAEVENRFGGKSEMLALTDDSISIRISNALRMTILLIEPLQPIDSVRQVICVAQTYGTDSISMSTRIEFYSPQWVKLERDISLSIHDKNRIKALDLQTIVNWPKERLKKNKKLLGDNPK